MRIAIIGTGNVGGTLGRLWAAGGHEIVFASRHPGSEKVRALLAQIGGGARAAPLTDAVPAAEVVVLALPFDAVPQALADCGASLDGKVLVDATNPLGPGGLTVSGEDSAGERVARLAPRARVVKAFNTIGWETLARPTFGNEIASLLIAGDDADAKATVGRLGAELGFEVVDAGPMEASRLLEPLAMLWIRLAYSQGQGRRIAFKLLQE